MNDYTEIQDYVAGQMFGCLDYNRMVDGIDAINESIRSEHEEATGLHNFQMIADPRAPKAVGYITYAASTYTLKTGSGLTVTTLRSDLCGVVFDTYIVNPIIVATPVSSGDDTCKIIARSNGACSIQTFSGGSGTGLAFYVAVFGGWVSGSSSRSL